MTPRAKAWIAVIRKHYVGRPLGARKAKLAEQAATVGNFKLL